MPALKNKHIWQKIYHPILHTFQNITFWFLFVISLLIFITGANYIGLGITCHRWWQEFNGLLSSLLTGALVSFLFFFLVVHIPETRKKQIIKGNLLKIYYGIKEEILIQVIFASQKGGRKDLQADTQTISLLMTAKGFRETFDPGSEGHEGFYAFRNWIDQDVQEYREIVWNLKLLARQIEYVLHNYPIDDERKFGFFKRLETYLLSIEHMGPGYVEEKALSSFIQEIFAQRNSAKGDVGYDIVEKMILEL